MLIEETSYESPEEFWAALAPEKLSVSATSPLLFRGHADEVWDLVPTLFRAPDKLPKYGIDPNYAGGAVLGEMVLLKEFADYLDASGLVIPGDCEDMRRSLHQQSLDSHLTRTKTGRLPFPPSSLLPLMALAQHHGLSTRLLDWTRRSYVAVYFAAVGALECERNKRPKPARLAVWILDPIFIHPHDDLEIIKLPGSNNRNVAAQAGVFTLLRQHFTGIHTPLSGPIDLRDYEPKLSQVSKALRKHTLSTEHARRLFDLCGLHMINGASLFPDYYGAARFVELARDFYNASGDPL